MLVRGKVDWDKTAEVVIVGYGMAGAVAAITAHDEGAEVVILEKQLSDNHYSNSTMSYGLFISPSDIVGAIRYMEELYQVDGEVWWTGRDIIRVWAEYSSQNKEWIEKLGGKTTLWSTVGMHRDVPGADSIHTYVFPGMGPRMMDFLYGQVRTRGIEVMYNTAAEKVLTNFNGEVVGVRANARGGDGSKKVNIKASRAVILTCGGFEFNEPMKLNYLRVYPTYFAGSPANTGDGIRMALDVGADLWHMNCCSAGIWLKFPDYSEGFFPVLGSPGWDRRISHSSAKREPAGYIVVDRYGKRFINENFVVTKFHCLYYEFVVFDSQRLEYPRVPCYWVFDQNRMEAGPLVFTLPPITTPSGRLRRYRWSQDNNQELERGWIITAQTVSELALRLGMQPDILDKTVETYNLCCGKGADPDFGRGARDLTHLSRPPFYAVKLWPGGPNTQGGPRRNHMSQVLNTGGDPIPRLYSAGELGSIYGMVYPSAGGNLAECIAFGRIAGENAAKEQSKSLPE
jgi:succinate dehydrogenase/fumarate reductase flavoprotein subunit